MNDADRKLLTEEVLGECWHEKSGTSYFVPHILGFPDVEDSFLCSMCGQKFRESEYRTFSTWQDLGDLKDKLVEKGMWNDFSAFAWDKWTDQCEGGRCPVEDYANWLLNPARFCQLVADWWKEEHHGQEP